MEWFTNFLQSSEGRSLIYFCLYVLVTVLVAIINAVRTKTKNDKLNEILGLLPDAMKFAEGKGGTSEDKLNNCMDFLSCRIKNLPEKIVISLIEQFIKVSKSVNIESQSTKEQKSIYSRTTRD